MDSALTAPFLNEERAREIAARYGTPVYVYDEATLRAAASLTTSCPSAFGLSVRFAMKACPNAAVLKIFNSMGLLFDASSGFEARRAMLAGIAPSKIQLTAQELPSDLEALVKQGVLFNACSLSQLRAYGELFKGSEVSFRVNPGLGSGGTNRTNTGGPASSFGIWHEQLDQTLSAAEKYSLRITGLHSHIGSGSDVAVWERCADLTLAVARQIPTLTRISLGGGYKVGRVPGENTTDLHVAMAAVKQKLEQFAASGGPKLHLEIEPGTFLVARAGAVLCKVIDVVDTGSTGYNFIKVDTGMTEILRPMLYGAQHPVTLFPAAARGPAKQYVVVGHCCESGDVITPSPGDPEGLAPRELQEAAPGDLLLIGAAGAYCAGMSSKNYNSFPEAPEVLLAQSGDTTLIRKRQTLEQILVNEVA